MYVALGHIRVHFPFSHSLKDKRQIVRKIKDKIKAKFTVIVAEVGDLDKWQIGELAFAFAGSDPKIMEKTMLQIEKELQVIESLSVLDFDTEVQMLKDMM